MSHQIYINAEIGEITNIKDTRTKVYKINIPASFSAYSGPSYFLISNHQKKYYSDALRGQGLLIAHVEDSTSNVYDIECPHGLVSAFGDLYVRGRDSLEADPGLHLKTYPKKEEYGNNYYDSLLVHFEEWYHTNKDYKYPFGAVHYRATGGITDFFDGVRYKEFSPYTNPNTSFDFHWTGSSWNFDNVPTHIAVLNIHKDAIDPSVMRADFRIDYVKQTEGSFVLNRDGTATLSWSPDPVFTNPTYHNIRYRIYRSTTQGSEYTYVDSVNGVSNTTFTDTGLISGKIYYYAVKTYCSTHNCESDYGFLNGNYINGNITTNATWSGTKWVNGYTYIKSGVTVTIPGNAYTFIGEGQKIVIESGGRLIVSLGGNLMCYGQVEVLTGGTLQASAGSIFKFASNSKLYVRGTFNAMGTSTSLITFTSTYSNPTASDYWYGIVFENGGKGTIQYANIKYSNYGVLCNNTNAGVNILNCNFTNNKQFSVKMTNSGYVYVANNNIQGTTYGVYQYKSANTTVENNTITNCSRGIFVYNSGGGIESNIVSGSSSYGLYIYLYSYPSLVDNLITNNTIGICSNYSTPVFYYDKGLNGVCLPNVIRDNSSHGIVVGGTIFTSLKDSHTRIYNNGGYEIMNNVYNTGTGQNQLNAEMCWWGSSTGAPPNLDSDFYPAGSVDFRPWANNTNCEYYPSSPGNKFDEIAQFKQDIEKEPNDLNSKSKLVIVTDYFWRNGKGKDVIPYLEEISIKHKGKKIGSLALQIMIAYLQREGKNNDALSRSISIMNDNTTEPEIRKSTMLNLAYIYKYDFNDRASARNIFNQFLSEYSDDESSWIAKMELDEMSNEIQSMQSANELVESSTPKQRVKISPNSFSLEQNYPNPFNPETSIDFALPEDGQTILRVYDITGRLVKTLIDEYKTAGYYSIKWNGQNEKGEMVPSGLYIYQITSGKYSSTKRMLLLK